MSTSLQPRPLTTPTGTLAHSFRKMVRDWHGRNMQNAELHELTRLHERMSPIAHTLTPHFDARNLYQRVVAELNRRQNS